MVKPREIVEVKKNKKGSITHVRLEGNATFADVSVVINLANIGKVNVKVSKKADGSEYLRLGKDIPVCPCEQLDAEPAPTSTPTSLVSKNKPVPKKSPVKKKSVPKKSPVKKKPVPKKSPVKKKPVPKKSPVKKKPVPKKSPVKKKPVPKKVSTVKNNV